MLVRYKKSLEKIAMGLLSYMPEEKEVKRLMETMQTYDNNESWQLFLWKKEDEYVGLVGVSIVASIATVQHISVLPSYRGEGIAINMLNELLNLDNIDEIKASERTASFIDKCLPLVKKA